MEPVIQNAEIQRRFQTFLDLCQAAEDMARQRFRRLDPSRSEDEIQQLVVEWQRQGATTSLPGCVPSDRTFG